MGYIIPFLTAEFSALGEFTGFARTAETCKRCLDLVLDFLFGWFLPVFCAMARLPSEIRTSFPATLLASSMCSGTLRRLIFTVPFPLLVVGRSACSTGRRHGLLLGLKFRQIDTPDDIRPRQPLGAGPDNFACGLGRFGFRVGLCHFRLCLYLRYRCFLRRSSWLVYGLVR